MAGEARHCDTLAPALRNGHGHRGEREAVSTNFIFALRHARRECSPLSCKQSLWKGEICLLWKEGDFSPPPTMTEQRANHEHSLLNQNEPQRKTQRDLCSFGLPRGVASSCSSCYRRPPPTGCWDLPHQVTSHKLLPQFHYLTKGTLLSPHTFKKALRPRGKWHKRGRY